MAAARKCRVNATFDEKKALEVSRQVWGNMPRGALGTGENEWFTPQDYLVLVRRVLGAIDLDPATHIQAQKTVRAARYFTRDDDGLSRKWHGRVWLNPPYSRDIIADFVNKLIAELCAGRVDAAIMLTHNYTDTTWFHEAASMANAICFTRGRIPFIRLGADEAEPGTPTEGQAFWYFGKQPSLFASTFEDVGLVMRRFKVKLAMR